MNDSVAFLNLCLALICVVGSYNAEHMEKTSIGVIEEKINGTE